MTHERSGLVADPSDLVDIAHLVSTYYTLEAGRRGHRPACGIRNVGASWVEPHRLVQRSPHRGDHAGHLRIPHHAVDRRSAVPRSRHPRALRARMGDGTRSARRQRRRRPDRRRRPVHADPGDLARHPPPQQRPHLRPRRRDRRHAVAQPTQGAAASSTTRRTADRPTPTPPGGSRREANELLGGSNTDVRRISLTRALAADTTVRYDYIGTYVDDLPSVLNLDAVREAGIRIGADPLGGGRCRLLGSNRRHPRPRPHRDQSARGSDVALHDARLGRSDQDGLLVASCDGVADRRS